jgi:hypothetical protein
MSDTSLLVESYLEWLQVGIKAEPLEDDVTQLTTPFLDRHNDHLQIYAERTKTGEFLLTDDGYIMSELKSSGVERHGRRREELLTDVLRGHGVTLNNKELQLTATQDSLGRRIHSLIQAMLRVDDMFVLAQPRVESIFLEDVEKFLDGRGVRYSSSVKLAGLSGLDHLYDFVIPKSSSAPERILQVVNSPRRDRAESLMFAVNDTKTARGHSINFFALVNDSRKSVSTEIMDAFRSYDITAMTWSHRDEMIAALAA